MLTKVVKCTYLSLLVIPLLRRNLSERSEMRKKVFSVDRVVNDFENQNVLWVFNDIEAAYATVLSKKGYKIEIHIVSSR